MENKETSPVVTMCGEPIVRLFCWMFRCEEAVVETPEGEKVIRVRAVSPKRYVEPVTAEPEVKEVQVDLF